MKKDIIMRLWCPTEIKKIINEKSDSLHIPGSLFVRLALKNGKIKVGDVQKYEKIFSEKKCVEYINFRLSDNLLQELQVKAKNLKIIVQDYLRVVCWKWTPTSEFLKFFQD